MKWGMSGSNQKRRRFLGGRRSREARKSAGISTESARAKRSSQEPGLRERMTSPVSESLRMKTSCEEKRKSAGRRKAWLRPFLKSLAVFGMAHPRQWKRRNLVYTMIYHKDKEFNGALENAKSYWTLTLKLAAAFGWISTDSPLGRYWNRTAGLDHSSSQPFSS